jgi:hypothetical protein
MALTLAALVSTESAEAGLKFRPSTAGELRSGPLEEFPPRRSGTSISVNTRPTEWVGALIPSSEASVGARSTGSA